MISIALGMKIVQLLTARDILILILSACQDILEGSPHRVIVLYYMLYISIYYIIYIILNCNCIVSVPGYLWKGALSTV